MFTKQDKRLVYSYDAEQLWIEPWGLNALRVRATKQAEMPSENWALQMELKAQPTATIMIEEKRASIVNGEIRAMITAAGKLTVYNHVTAKLLPEEYARNRSDLLDPKYSSLAIEAREFAPVLGGDYKFTQRFESLDRHGIATKISSAWASINSRT